MNKQTIMLAIFLFTSLILFTVCSYYALIHTFEWGKTVDVESNIETSKTYFFIGLSALFFISSLFASGLWRTRRLTLYRQVFERSNDAIGVISTDGKYMLQNSSHRELLGWRDDDLVTLEPQYYIGSQKYNTATHLEELKQFSGEFRVEKYGGELIDVGLSAYTVTDELNDPLFFVEIKRDIREFKKLQEELKIGSERLRVAHESIQHSIGYARRIQKSFLPNESALKHSLEIECKYPIVDYTFIWNPKDTIGGDCYWFESDESGKTFIALIDCTGHGVPGAMMTFVVLSLLRKFLSHKSTWDKPSELLSAMNRAIKNSLQQNESQESGESDDGMDGAFFCIDSKEGTITYAGANIGLFILDSDREIIDIKPDKSSVGYKSTSYEQQFTDIKLEIKKGMSIYLSTDGIFDQLGEKKRMAFGKKRFKELIKAKEYQNLEEFKDEFLENFYEYRGNQMQRDDNTMIAISF